MYQILEKHLEEIIRKIENNELDSFNLELLSNCLLNVSNKINSKYLSDYFQRLSEEIKTDLSKVSHLKKISSILQDFTPDSPLTVIPISISRVVTLTASDTGISQSVRLNPGQEHKFSILNAQFMLKFTNGIQDSSPTYHIKEISTEKSYIKIRIFGEYLIKDTHIEAQGSYFYISYLDFFRISIHLINTENWYRKEYSFSESKFFKVVNNEIKYVPKFIREIIRIEKCETGWVIGGTHDSFRYIGDPFERFKPAYVSLISSEIFISNKSYMISISN